MKRMTGLIRLHRWKLEERLRDLQELENLHERLKTQTMDLDEELAHEKTVAREYHEASYTFSAYTKQVIGRREKLKDSICEVIAQTQEVEEAVAEAYRELKKYELAEAAQLQRQKKYLERRQQIEFDEISINSYRRRMKG